MVCLGDLNNLWGEPISLGKKNLYDSLGSVCIDSRNLSSGDFFVPLVGESFDGHSFLEEVFDKGAQATIVAKDSRFHVPKNLTHWIVEDTLYAYQQLGMLHRLSLGLPVIGVTGSAGKTTTREMIKSAISSLGNILATNENNNNDVGVPFTLLQCSSSHCAVIIEMGMRGLGEISRLSFCAKPDIAVITNIGSAHIGRLGDRSAIANAKCEITSYLKPDGVVIIPANDLLLEKTLKSYWDGRILRVALRDNSSLNSNKKINNSYSKSGIDFIGDLNMEKGLLTVGNNFFNLPLKGSHNALNFLLAIAVARELNVPFEKLQNIQVELPYGRSKIYNNGQINILDETYNSSPEAVEASLELLVRQPGRHFVVLGTMHELGEHSLYFHEKIAQLVVKLKLDGMVIVSEGAEAEVMESVANVLPKLLIVPAPENAVDCLKEWLLPGDNLLVKGSRAVGLDRLIPLLS